MIKYQQSSRIYITHKIEPPRFIADLQYGDKNDMSNIFDTLVTNSAFLSCKKFKRLKEHSIVFISQNGPPITPCEILFTKKCKISSCGFISMTKKANSC